MKKRTKSNILKALLGIGIIAGGFFLMRYLSGLKTDPPKREIPQRIKAVETRTVTNAALASTLDVQGRLQAYNKIDIFSEVGGVVEESGRPLKEGTYFPKGNVIVRIDDTEARLNLQAQKATLMNGVAQIMPDLKIDYPQAFPAWETYLDEFSVDEPLPPLPETDDRQARLFIAGRNLYTQYYSIKSLEERLSKYTLTAPFSGELTEVMVDRGALVRAGQQIGTLMGTGYYELVATVPLSELEYLQTGAEVELYSEDIAGEWTGKVSRISSEIDPGSQTVGVYIGVSGRDLREGMYMRGAADSRTLDDVVEIDRDLLLNGDEVYVVQNDTLLRRQPVRVQKRNRETVIVGGLPDGAKLLTSTVAGAFDGMRVRLQDAGGAAGAKASETAANRSQSTTEASLK